MRTVASPLVYISVLLLTACAAEYIPFTYSMEVQQGTIIEQDRVERLEPGMTRRQVEFLMGSPALVDPFEDERWEYIYSLRHKGRHRAYERVTVFFDGDRVSDIRIAGALGES